MTCPSAPRTSPEAFVSSPPSVNVAQTLLSTDRSSTASGGFESGVAYCCACGRPGPRCAPRNGCRTRRCGRAGPRACRGISRDLRSCPRRRRAGRGRSTGRRARRRRSGRRGRRPCDDRVGDPAVVAVLVDEALALRVDEDALDMRDRGKEGRRHQAFVHVTAAHRRPCPCGCRSRRRRRSRSGAPVREVRGVVLDHRTVHDEAAGRQDHATRRLDRDLLAGRARSRRPRDPTSSRQGHGLVRISTPTSSRASIICSMM